MRRRNRREGEVDGVDYLFKCRDELEGMIEKKKLVEWGEYVGKY